MIWNHDGDTHTWTSGYFEIELMTSDDPGTGSPMWPPMHTYLLTLGNTSFGSFDALDAAKAEAEKLDNSTHPETAAAVRRALGLQPPYPVAEAVPCSQDMKRKMERLYAKRQVA